MCDSSSLSARSSDDQTLLDRARRLRNGKLIEQIQSIARRKTALKGSKDGLDKFKGSSLPELRVPSDYPKFDQAVRNALRPKRGGPPLLEYEAFREWKELGIDPPFEIKNPAPVNYDPLTATAEENKLREELEHLEGAEAASELLADIADEQTDTGEPDSDPEEGYESLDPADFPVFTPVEVFADGKWQKDEGAYVAAQSDADTHQTEVFVFRDHKSDGAPLRAAKWYPADLVRRVAGPAQPFRKQSKIALPVGKTVKFDKSKTGDAISNGYDTSWPACFNFWRYDQVDDDAINLNSFLYPEIVARITHKDIKKIVEAESQELVTNLLLILRRELGNTKGTQAVMLHREHAVLRYVDLRSFVVQMRRFRAYRQKIDPDLALLLDILEPVQSAVENDRDDAARRQIADGLDAAVTALNDTDAQPIEILESLEKHLVKAAANLQTSSSLSTKPATKKANFAGTGKGAPPSSQGKKLPCFYRVAGRKCPKGKDCTLSHDGKIIKEFKERMQKDDRLHRRLGDRRV